MRLFAGERVGSGTHPNTTAYVVRSLASIAVKLTNMGFNLSISLNRYGDNISLLLIPPANYTCQILFKNWRSHASDCNRSNLPFDGDYNPPTPALFISPRHHCRLVTARRSR